MAHPTEWWLILKRNDGSIVSDRWIKLVRNTHMDNKLICFGFLEKDEVSSLTLSDQKDASNAKMINLDDYVFWIADATNIKMRQIIINGYDAESKQVLEYEEILKGN